MKVPFFLPYNEIHIEYMKTYEKFSIPVQQYHNGYELLLVINGERSFFYNDICYTLRRGDVAVIKPFELHCAESTEMNFYERYALNFRPEDLDCVLSEQETAQLFDNLNSKLLHLNDEQFDIVIGVFALIYSLVSTKNPLSQKAAASAVTSLVLYLNNIEPTSLSTVPIELPQEVIFAINYVNANYQSALTLDMLSDMIHISKYHFCRIFKEATGTTFLEYVNNVRLSHAHRLLSQTDMSMREIAVKTGFSSAEYFSRVFKKTHGVSPKQARL